MQDNILLNKISQALEEICEKGKINTIKAFTLIINEDSPIDEESLLKYVNLHNKDRVGKDLKIDIQREDLGKQTAILANIQ